MKPGPKSAPTSLKAVRGDRPSRTNARAPEAEPVGEIPAAPEWLAEGAKGVWDSLAPTLHEKGVLTAWDVETFAVFCEAVIHHHAACAAVDDATVIQQTRFGQTKHPALQIVRDQANIIRAYAQEFGLTPSARSGVHLPDGDRFDDARHLLS